MLVYIFYEKYKSKKDIEKIKSILDHKLKNRDLSASKLELNNEDLDFVVDDFNKILAENNDLNNKVKSLDEEHRDLLANLSHDLRTPLTSLIGYIDLFKKSPDNKQEYLEVLEKRSEALKNLIEKFYLYSLMPSYELKNLERINLIEFIFNKTLNYYDLFKQAGQDIKIEKNIESFYYDVDPKLFEFLLNNALDNMLKYSEGENKISIETDYNKLDIIFSNKADLEDGNYDYLFEKMEVIDKSRKNSTGLGLSILKSASDKLGFESHIDVEDRVFNLSIKIRK